MGFIGELVESALGKQIKDVAACRLLVDVDRLLKRGKPVSVLWVMDTVADPIFQFWRLADKKILILGTNVVFTGISNMKKSFPLWNDLKDFEGGKFGDIYLLTYDPGLNVGVKPSQRGMYFK